MRAGVNTVETEGAIHIAGFAWLEELQLASALRLVSLETVMRFTCAADSEIADAYFERRNQRLEKLILTDGTDKLAEACTRKETVNDDGRREVTNYQHRGGPRVIPQAEGFIGPEENQEQRDRDPF